ncbi:MAG: L-threonylcarbamoyladenylate synthase [Candidatus Paceibacterota bacterium]
MVSPRNKKELINDIRHGAVGIIPTDTVYGIVASAKHSEAVERIYELKGRDSNKPFVILISSLHDLSLFRVPLSQTAHNILSKIWPAEISVILPCKQKRFYYLHRGRKSLAFRMPHNHKLLELLKKTGPLASSSANLSGQPASKNIAQAKEYFARQVDFYVSGGELNNPPSTLVEIRGKKIFVKRQGSVKIDKAIAP